MNKITFVVLALVSLLLSGCAATSAIPPEKQKDYALIKIDPFTINGNAAINSIDDAISISFSRDGRNVLPGRHNVLISICHVGPSTCAQYNYIFTANAGLAYLLGSRGIKVVDRFDLTKSVDFLTQIRPGTPNAPYFTKKEVEEYVAELTKEKNEKEAKINAEEAAAQAIVTERRKNNLSLVKKIGARICQERSVTNRGYTNQFIYIGFVEAISEDKVQIRISDAYLKALKTSQSSRPEGFTSSIIWDSPMNWDLCE